VRYGERTARGIAGGKRFCWDLTFRRRRSVRSSKKIVGRDTIAKDIAFVDRNGQKL
jgi:hypothetical protein